MKPLAMIIATFGLFALAALSWSCSSPKAVEQPKAAPTAQPSEPNMAEDSIDDDEAVEANTVESHPDFESFIDRLESGGEHVRSLGVRRWSIAQDCAPGVDGKCQVRLTFDGRGAVIYQNYDCGDSCSIRWFVWPDTKAAPELVEFEKLPIYALDAMPSRSLVVFDSDAGSMDLRDFATYKLDLESGEFTRITTDCFAPRIAPDTETVICRDGEANVRAVPISGGAAKIIAEAAIPESHRVYLRLQWGVWPTPVVVVSNDRIAYTVEMEDPESGEVERISRELQLTAKTGKSGEPPRSGTTLSDEGRLPKLYFHTKTYSALGDIHCLEP